MENIGRDLLMKQLRDFLNAEKIKLWLPPYTTENKEKGHVPEDLIIKFGKELKFSSEEIADGLEELRLHSLSKLEERDKFKKQGIATLRIKMTGQLTTESASRKPFPLECSLDVTGSDLKALVAGQRSVPESLLKLICQGKVVDEKQPLRQQGIVSGSDVMAMVMSTTDAAVAEKEADAIEVERTRQAAELLSSREDDDEDFDIQIADQNGRSLQLPKEEKRALTVAMTFHEKGRTALKNKKVSLALPLFLEADSEFSKCRSELLQATDNYAILCLDIVWCYLALKNLEQLPDAETRLRKSELCFKRCYGEQMERLASIKGGTGAEQALLMRLYLLQGIVAFHKGDITSARNLLGRAEFVLTLLHVDDTQLNEIMLMGFTERESRLGLRAKNGNVAQAVEFIMETRKKQEEVNNHAKTDWHRRVRGKKLGKTAGGEPVNVDHYDSLVDMDFPPGGAAEALRQANNDISAAIEILNTKPELLSLPDPENKTVEITDEMIIQVTGLGFDTEVARQALRQFRGNIQRAVDNLLKHGGLLPHLPHSPSGSSTSASESSPTSVSSSSGSEISNSELGNTKRLKQEEKEALNSFVTDISTDANEYLDLTLSEEREILQLYQGMLGSLPVSGKSH
uniref:UBA domain-containing protein n=1 Tax=Arion vulgaris TaxID=1028688 RepID=A0A0B7AFM1_9EUPU